MKEKQNRQIERHQDCCQREKWRKRERGIKIE